MACTEAGGISGLDGVKVLTFAAAIGLRGVGLERPPNFWLAGLAKVGDFTDDEGVPTKDIGLGLPVVFPDPEAVGPWSFLTGLGGLMLEAALVGLGIDVLTLRLGGTPTAGCNECLVFAGEVGLAIPWLLPTP